MDPMIPIVDPRICFFVASLTRWTNLAISAAVCFAYALESSTTLATWAEDGTFLAILLASATLIATILFAAAALFPLVA